ncbi:MAG TPA: hypothetical protein VMG59_01475 [Phycisphaerae bacterium]|nr:hypothetical protein [Phycisphaerae bacterium]
MFDEKKTQHDSGFGDFENKPNPPEDSLSQADSFLPPPSKPLDKESSATGFAAILARGGVEESPSISGLSANADPGGKVGSSSIIEAISDRPRSRYAEIPEAKVIEFRKEPEPRARESAPTPTADLPPSASPCTDTSVHRPGSTQDHRINFWFVPMMMILGAVLLLIGLWAIGVLKDFAVPFGPSSDPEAIKSAKTFAYIMLIALPVGFALLMLALVLLFSPYVRKK